MIGASCNELGLSEIEPDFFVFLTITTTVTMPDTSCALAPAL